MINKPLQQDNSFYQKLFRSLVSIVLIILILYWGQSILVPIAFASLFALLLMAPSNFFERFGIGRGFSALISTLLFIIAGVVVFYFISSQVISFRADMPKLGELLLTSLHDLQEWVTQKFSVSTSSINEFVHNATSKTLSNSSSIIESTVGTVSGTVIYILLIPIFTFLLLYYRGMLMHFFIKLFNEKYTASVKEVFGKIQYVIKGYIIGLLIEMIIVATMNCAGFFILGVKYALLLGVIAAVLNVIPYLGIFTACIISVLITSTTNTPGVVTGVAIVLIVVHLLDSNIILPKVVGSKVKINVLATILAVLAGSELWGIPGMFLAIPIIAILKIIFDATEELRPWGYLIGDEPKLPPITKVYRNWKKLIRKAKK
jgi:putative permease